MKAPTPIMLSAESAAGKFPVEAVSTMNRIGEEVERDPTYRGVLNAQRAEPEADRRRRHRRRRAADRRDARSVRDHLLDQFGIDRAARRARAAEAAGGGDHAEPGHRAQAVGGVGRALRGRRRRPRPRRHGRTAPAASPSATALPRPASASSSSPACRSAPPAPPTWCASPMSARTRRGYVRRASHHSGMVRDRSADPGWSHDPECRNPGSMRPERRQTLSSAASRPA